jgi:hypothetical protein
MSKKYYTNILIVIFCGLFYGFSVSAQVSAWQEPRRGSVYFSIGTASNTYFASDLHIYQYLLNNDYVLSSVAASNKPGSESAIFGFNYCLGYYFNYNQKWALELCYQPMHYSVTDQQNLHLKGIVNGNTVADSNVSFSAKNGYSYNMNNKSGLMQFNIVRRVPVYRNKVRNFSLDLLGKVGFGPIVLYPQNDFSSGVNTPKFDNSGGWNYAVSVGAKFTLYRRFYFEAGYKFAYALLNNIDIYSGYVNQNLMLTSWSISAGLHLPTTKHNPMFRKGFKRPKGLPNGPEPRGDLDSNGASIYVKQMQQLLRRSKPVLTTIRVPAVVDTSKIKAKADSAVPPSVVPVRDTAKTPAPADTTTPAPVPAQDTTSQPAPAPPDTTSTPTTVPPQDKVRLLPAIPELPIAPRNNIPAEPEQAPLPNQDFRQLPFNRELEAERVE